MFLLAKALPLVNSCPLFELLVPNNQLLVSPTRAPKRVVIIVNKGLDDIPRNP